jgi:hypothetical protein
MRGLKQQHDERKKKKVDTELTAGLGTRHTTM